MPDVILVVPCYNEAERLPVPEFVDYARRHPSHRLLFVDDGSSDATLQVLTGMAGLVPDGIRVMRLDGRRGKGEAVRQGVLAAFEGSPAYVGYWDADLAAPLEAIPEWLRLLEDRPRIEMVLGSRVRLLGRDIRRRGMRRMLGSAFAAAARLVLGVPVHDVLCGAKLFRATPRVKSLFAARFRTAWIFDVEVLARLLGESGLSAGQGIYEIPLERWREVGGSKLRVRDVARAAFDLAVVWWSGRPKRCRQAGPVAADSVPAGR